MHIFALPTSVLMPESRKRTKNPSIENILLALPRETAQEIREMAKDGERPLQAQLRLIIRIGMEVLRQQQQRSNEL
jgi:hypothetical protein